MLVHRNGKKCYSSELTPVFYHRIELILAKKGTERRSNILTHRMENPNRSGQGFKFFFFYQLLCPKFTRRTAERHTIEKG